MNNSRLSPKKVGKTIAALRISKGLSQEVLSGLADISRTHLSAIERGIRTPTLGTLCRISEALNVQMSSIIKEIENDTETK